MDGLLCLKSAGADVFEAQAMPFSLMNSRPGNLYPHSFQRCLTSSTWGFGFSADQSVFHSIFAA